VPHESNYYETPINPPPIPIESEYYEGALNQPREKSDTSPYYEGTLKVESDQQQHSGK
jgi:hypothetical protein